MLIEKKPQNKNKKYLDLDWQKDKNGLRFAKIKCPRCGMPAKLRELPSIGNIKFKDNFMLVCNFCSEKYEQEKASNKNSELLRKIKSIFADERIPTDYAFKTFENFVISDDPMAATVQKSILAAVREHVRDVDLDFQKGALRVFIGAKNTCKTIFASIVFKEFYLNKNFIMQIYNSRKLCNEISTWRKEDVFDRLLKLDYLIIDDFAIDEANKLSDFFQRLFVERVKNKKVTLITTNTPSIDNFQNFMGSENYDFLEKKETIIFYLFDWEPEKGGFDE